MKHIRLLWLPILLGLLLFPTNTFAKGLFEHQNTNILSNETVDDVVVIGGDASIAGTVEDSVVVINGDVHLLPGAHIDGIIIVIGGNLQQDDGAVVTNEVIAISFDNATVNSLIIGAGLIIGIGVLQLAGSLLMLILPVLMVAIGKRHAAAFVNRFRKFPRGKLLSMGFFAWLLLLAVTMLLVLTIVGIPFILLIALIIFVAVAFGLTVMSQLLGEQLQGMVGKPEWMRTGAGAFILAASVNIPFIGLLILFVIILFSLGITTSWTASKLFDRTKRISK
ncbi:hypothetical protein [Cohnella yongneupensis]|uniref:DUF8173 domain-containing protein n=1 Tax=Cohnella yongneupensis TaxID=425006 RepID=A0ABW0QZ57_9BACL